MYSTANISIHLMNTMSVLYVGVVVDIVVYLSGCFCQLCVLITENGLAAVLWIPSPLRWNFFPA
jgi:hypothetical protein